MTTAPIFRSQQIRKKWQKGPDDTPLSIPLVVAGEEIFDDREIRDAHDPSQFDPKTVVARIAMADGGDIDHAVATAAEDELGKCLAGVWISRVEQVITTAAIDRVAAQPTDDLVIAVIPLDIVVTGAGPRRIVARS